MRRARPPRLPGREPRTGRRPRERGEQIACTSARTRQVQPPQLGGGRLGQGPGCPCRLRVRRQALRPTQAREGHVGPASMSSFATTARSKCRAADSRSPVHCASRPSRRARSTRAERRAAPVGAVPARRRQQQPVAGCRDLYVAQRNRDLPDLSHGGAPAGPERHPVGHVAKRCEGVDGRRAVAAQHEQHWPSHLHQRKSSGRSPSTWSAPSGRSLGLPRT